MSDIASTAAVIRGRRYPFRNLTERDRAYLSFWASLIDQHGGSVTLAQIVQSGKFPDYHGARKPDDAGVAIGLVKAGLITAPDDGNTLTLTEGGRRLLVDDAYIADTEAEKEIERLKRLGEIASRPGQRAFSREVRIAYQNKCAVTGCCTPAALEAAHIRTQKDADINQVSNGILLRADIHSLFDRGLIALAPDGTRFELSTRLNDPTYEFLKNARVFRPSPDAPSAASIAHHRQQFGFT